MSGLVYKKPTYSYTRLSTFNSCKLKYYLTYKEGYASEGPLPIKTRKGTAFHQFAEKYDPSWSFDFLKKKIDDLNTEFQLTDEFSIEKPVQRFLHFYDHMIAPYLFKEGAEVFVEKKVDLEIEGKSFTATFDVLIKNNDQFVLIDYKTSNSLNTNYYKDQILLYLYVLSQFYQIDIQDIPNRIKSYIYFAFSSPHLNWEEVLKEIKFSSSDVIKALEKNIAMIHFIESNQWEPEPTLSSLCEFCPFAGFPEYCRLSYESGIIRKRGVKIIKRW